MIQVDDQIVMGSLTIDLNSADEPMLKPVYRSQSMPPLRQLVLQRGTISAYSHIGNRKSNQDRVYSYVIQFDVRLHGQDVLIGIFDGHGSGHVVDYVSDNLLDRIIQSKWYASGIITKAISEAFREIEESLLIGEWGDSMDGCVGQVAVLRGDTLTIANIGDCRTIKIHESGSEDVSYIQLSTDHIPENPLESQNVRDKGGLILRVNKSLRVNGQINVTRSLGDKRLKDILSAEPQILEYQISARDKMLVMASDGLWSVHSRFMQLVSNKAVAENVQRHLGEQNMARSVVYNLGVRLEDNITVVCLRL